MFASYNPDNYFQILKQVQEQREILEKGNQEDKQQMQSQLEDQNNQLQQNIQLSNQIRESLQDESKTHFPDVSKAELETTLQQTTQNEKILQQNIININEYME